MKICAAISALVAGSVLASAAAQAEAPDLNAAQSRGRALFHESCIYCHGDSGFATRTLERRLGEDFAKLEARRDLQGPYITFVVRRGLNSMPWYRRTELSDAELANIVAYLTRETPNAAPSQGASSR